MKKNHIGQAPTLLVWIWEMQQNWPCHTITLNPKKPFLQEFWPNISFKVSQKALLKIFFNFRRHRYWFCWSFFLFQDKHMQFNWIYVTLSQNGALSFMYDFMKNISNVTLSLYAYFKTVHAPCRLLMVTIFKHSCILITIYHASFSFRNLSRKVKF